MFKVFKIRTKNDTVIVSAKDKREAWGKYFKDVINQNVSISDLGNILMLTDENGEETPCRVVPILWKMEVINDETAIASLRAIGVATSNNEARKLLETTSKADSWIAEEIDRLTLIEKGGD